MQSEEPGDRGIRLFSVWLKKYRKSAIKIQFLTSGRMDGRGERIRRRDRMDAQGRAASEDVHSGQEDQPEKTWEGSFPPAGAVYGLLRGQEDSKKARQRLTAWSVNVPG